MNAPEYAEKASEIFVLSDSFIRIKELIDNESSTIDDIADVILLDPALSGTILKLSNSSFFNYPGQIDTISKAVLIIGITEVYNLVIAYFSTKACRKIKTDPEYLNDFWERSVDCALTVKFLGAKLSVPNAERLFILGLLHNLGELVMHQFMPEKVETCKQVNSDELPWTKQLQFFGFSYADVTAELLKQWQLPYSLIEPIRDQDGEDFEHSTDETKLLYIAKRVMTLNHECKSHDPSVVITDEKLDSLAVQKELLRDASDFCDMERLSILAVLNPSAFMLY
ncbi:MULTISPECIES: HDOD domain-containing protein [unclassified Colwellia]|jgi:HD-like signal output (HDOD) protein|uniref:HDOD domain-containing protein n=1 Tax=unclassified Colwellia TaxID=196834 RepID=UPI0015F36626|nr:MULTISPECIES: HDOD domain-containing protein [unclassified Colwellia]MBA6232598.1 HDOD domain-containing protein [Colwellia sp. MB02u-7]MBA6235261.1 HDOD domain-containing protein [Colwellia sp. MB02u-11]MBA6257917.1 HDOD domain-containing protein [Colwellia sp. MB3u-28]MBA6258403.1 HDOD domain-containing protein [Colwellia sp. MB3u-41]MBA6299311.1 HDOD domain-containing protein [Colwellia sp. MB3u-22]